MISDELYGVYVLTENDKWRLQNAFTDLAGAKRCASGLKTRYRLKRNRVFAGDKIITIKVVGYCGAQDMYEEYLEVDD